MKHAGGAALDALEPVLARLREIPQLREKSRGTFYRGAKAFLHFHEDPVGFFADVRLAHDFVRVPVNSRAEIESLIRDVKRTVSR